MKFLALLLLVPAILAAQPETLYTVAPTGSMRPVFDESYYLFVTKLEWKDIKVGDIIVYRSSRPYLFENAEYWLVVHKVWQKSSGGSVILCWGTDNPSPDAELITEDMYVGTVLRWVKKDEYFAAL